MDFTACFNLLAARPVHAHTHCEDAHAHHQHDDSDVESLAAALNEQLNGVSDNKATSSSAQEQQHESKDNAQQEPFAELPVTALARLFFKLQETRVEIYSDFQKGFEVHQQTAQFPEYCTQYHAMDSLQTRWKMRLTHLIVWWTFSCIAARITARFSSVSLQINKIEKELIAKKKQVLAQYVRKIQVEEKEKLLMTSALMIEKMRLRDALKQPEPDASITALLDKSIDTLTKQHTAIILRINDLLDELRMEVVDFDDEE
ncbi:hypothetical protein FI667_g12469, partial [Globisporangium splendens]